MNFRHSYVKHPVDKNLLFSFFFFVLWRVELSKWNYISGSSVITFLSEQQLLRKRFQQRFLRDCPFSPTCTRLEPYQEYHFEQCQLRWGFRGSSFTLRFTLPRTAGEVKGHWSQYNAIQVPRDLREASRRRAGYEVTPYDHIAGLAKMVGSVCCGPS